MRNYFLILLTSISMVCSAQDKVTFHNGSVADGKVTEVTDQFIKFIYQGEETVNTYGSIGVSEITFASGRKQYITDKIIINNGNDWEKVRVAYDKNEVMGMKSMGRIEKHSNGAWSMHNSEGHFMKKALMKAQKEAAKKGACCVLVVSQSNGNAGQYPDSSIICELFTY